MFLPRDSSLFPTVFDYFDIEDLYRFRFFGNSWQMHYNFQLSSLGGKCISCDETENHKSIIPWLCDTCYEDEGRCQRCGDLDEYDSVKCCRQCHRNVSYACIDCCLVETGCQTTEGTCRDCFKNDDLNCHDCEEFIGLEFLKKHESFIHGEDRAYCHKCELKNN
jgi:hypothetical protein